MPVQGKTFLSQGVSVIHVVYWSHDKHLLYWSHLTNLITLYCVGGRLVGLEG